MNSTEDDLRDLFAAFALSGYLAAHGDATGFPYEPKTASDCYDYADAMLKERRKRLNEKETS